MGRSWYDPRNELTRSIARPIFCHNEKSRQSLLASPRVLQQEIDLSVVKRWLKRCSSNHGVACRSTGNPVDGLKVINCRNLTVEKARPSIPYAALSYVWGGVESAQVCTPSDDAVPLPEDLPKTIRDAITVCNGVHTPYLWVDSLCIDQGNSKEITDQINQMSSIYKGARFTIVAATGKDSNAGLPGVNDSKRSTQPVANVGKLQLISTMRPPIYAIPESIWASRGWTLQEAVLSHRRLVFTDDQLYFEC
ncbi:HET-domain-containing protein, partial [Mytilinidion resinicola]